MTSSNDYEINQDRFSSNQHDTSKKVDDATTTTIFDTIDQNQNYTQNVDDINNHNIANFTKDSFDENDAHLSEDEDELFLVLEPPQQVSKLGVIL